MKRIYQCIAIILFLLIPVKTLCVIPKFKLQYKTISNSWKNAQYSEVFFQGTNLLAKITNEKKRPVVSTPMLNSIGEPLPGKSHFSNICFTSLSTVLLSPFWLADVFDKAKASIGRWDKKVFPNLYYTPIDRHFTKREQRDLFRIIGISAFKLGRYDDAAKFLELYLNTEENFRMSIRREDRRIGYISKYYNDVELLIYSLIKSNRAMDAFRYAEFNKAKLLSETFLSSSLGDYEQKLVRKINIAKAQQEAIMMKESISQNEINNFKRGIAIFKDVKQNYKKSKNHTFLLSRKIIPELLSKKKLELYDSETIIISYFFGRNYLYIAACQNGNIIKHHLLDVPKKSIIKDINLLLLYVQSGNFRTEQIANMLYKKLVEPVLPSEVGAKRIIISPHGPLQNLPFSLLKSHRYLVEQYEVSYTNSINFLCLMLNYHGLRGVVPSELKPILIGNPYNKFIESIDLPFAEKEAYVIRDIFLSISSNPNSIHLMTGKSATESIFRLRAAEYNMIHFATHSKFDLINSDRSFILLANDTLNDGVLYAKEIYNLQNVDGYELIVMSSCESGAVELKAGNDPYGLTRSFFTIGAKRIISTLWEIDDDVTFKIMNNFYTYFLKENLNPNSALKKALISEIKKKNGFYWAAFKLEGIPTY